MLRGELNEIEGVRHGCDFKGLLMQDEVRVSEICVNTLKFQFIYVVRFLCSWLEATKSL